jgi:predicted amidohydrolase YtcJ
MQKNLKTIIFSTLFITKIAIGQNADVIFTNANIITAANKGARANSMGIKDGKILFVGDLKTNSQFKNAQTKLIDLKGKTIIPGFNDVHLHPSPETNFNELDHVLKIDTVTSIQSLIKLLSKKASITPKGMLIRARGYNESKLGKEPTCDILDLASTNHPIFITHASGHKSVANSYLLRINNINKETPNPNGGTFERFSDGSPNGICKEAAASNLTKNEAIVPFPEKSFQELVDNYKNYFNTLLSFGITSIGDAGSDAKRLKIYEQLEATHFPMRFNIMMLDKLLPIMEGGDAHHETDSWKTLADFNNATIPQIETDFLRVKSIKVFHGNSLSGKTCWLYEPYNMVNPATGKNDYYGIQYKRTQAELDSLFLAIHKQGLQICVHSNGDREIDMVLNAFEKVYASGNPLNIHHRIEHCSVINDSIILRIKKLGVIPVLHNYINELGDLLDPYGEARLNNMFATKSFLNAGILPALHSDAPVSSYDPRIRWESTVLRTSSAGKVLGPKQCVDAEDALIMYTKGGANATGELSKKGTLENGKLADFVIIKENPLQIDAKNLHSIHILETWVNGKMVYKSKKE